MTRATPLRVVHGDPGAAEFDRPVPHNIEAEQCVLGAVMLSPVALAEVRPLLEGTEFHRPQHARIWEAITALDDRGAPADPLAVGAEIGHRELAKAGGAPYLHTLLTKVPTATNATYYAHMLRDLAYARAVVTTGTRLIQLGHEDTGAGGLRALVTAELAAVTAADARGWGDPVPLSSSPQLPRFPVWALPDWIGEYAAGLAEITQTPPDLAGCLALAVLAVAAGGKVWVNAGAWSEPTNLYTVIVLPPGSRKSEVYAAMVKPIKAAEAKLIEDERPHIEERRIAYRLAEAATERAAKAAETATDQTTALADANAAALELAAITVPPEPALYSSNTTPEKLTSLLAAQGGRFAVLAPEGKIFSILAGQYSKTPDLEVFLSGHAGEEMRIDRMGRPSERIDAATLTLGVCVQPGVLARLAETPEFREQGLLGRLLFSLPDSLLGYRNERPDPIPEHITAAYRTNLTALILSLNKLGDTNTRTNTETGTDDAGTHALQERHRHTLHFTPDAQEAVIELLAATEPRFRPGGDFAHMTDWAGKYVGATVRIAALLHLAKHFRHGWERPIDTATFTDATQISEYYTAHAQAAYDAIGADPAVSNARALLDWIRRTATTRFTARDLMRSTLKNRFAKAADTDTALHLLETHGWTRRIPPPPTAARGRPTAPAYETHPTLIQSTP